MGMPMGALDGRGGQNKGAERDFFSAEGEYDVLNEAYYSRVIELVRKTAPPKPQQLVLDAGCGSGAWGVRLAGAGYVVYGIDLSPQLVKQACALAALEQVAFFPVLGDLEAMPFKQAVFDLVVCAFTLHHFPDLTVVAGQLYECVKPEGRMILIEPNGSNPVRRVSLGLKRLFGRRVFDRMGFSTPNEVEHGYSQYIRVLSEAGFSDFELAMESYIPTDGLAENGVWGPALGIRNMLFRIAQRCLPSPYCGTDLVLIASKK